MKHRLKPFHVDAIQWTGDNAAELEVFTDRRFAALDEDDRKNCDDPEATAQLAETASGQWVLVFPNDWIIRNFKGEFFRSRDEVFRAHYEPEGGEPAVDESPVPEGMVRLTLRLTSAARTVDVDQAEYELAKVEGEADQFLDPYLSDLDGRSEVVEPDGQVYRPFDQPFGPTPVV